MNGILILDKPSGVTSQTIISKVKHILNIKKIGHAGTLDPMATGVLIVLIGKATKLSDYIICDNKEYIAEVTIGVDTSTEDITGDVINKVIVDQETSMIDNKKVDEVLAGLKGKLKQVPPMYSSVHYNGTKLYILAHEGITVEREAREIQIDKINRVSDIKFSNEVATFSFQSNVSKGTYIRTLCVEIGKRLGFPATMSSLKRISSGKYKIEDAYTIDDIRNNNFHLISMIDALDKHNVVEVESVELKNRILNGMFIYDDFKSELVFFKENDDLLAIYEKENNYYRAKRVWN